MNTKVIVIGGGIAGLTTAYALDKQGVPVKILEIRDKVGGVIQTISREGYLVEMGPSTILESSPLVTTLIEELGLTPQKIYPKAYAKIRYIVRGKKALPLPHSPFSLFSTKLFSLSGKLRLFKEPFISGLKEDKEESLAQFITRRLGKEALDYLVNPFVAGIYAGDPEKLSVKYAMPKLYQLEREYGSLLRGSIKSAKKKKRTRPEIFSFTSGLETLVKAIGAKLQEKIHCNSQVVDVSQKEQGWRVTYIVDGEQKEIHSEYVVYAGTVYGLPNLTINNSPCDDFVRLAKMPYVPVSTLALGWEKKDIAHPLNGFGVLIPKVENMNILGALFPSSLFANRAPKDHVLLSIFIGGARNPEKASLQKEELVKQAQRDIE